MNHAIAVDLGGTNLRVGLVSPEGEILFQDKVPSPSKLKTQESLEEIASVIQKVIEAGGRKKIAGIALGIPGIVDIKKGVIYQAPHFPNWKNLEIRSFFGKRFSTKVVVDNDCHMIARGEAWKGAGKGLESFMLLTLGTGIGGGIYWKGEILSGDSGFGGEVGHIVIETEGRRCDCGSRGCLEMYASATGILHEIEKDTDGGENRRRFLEKIGGISKVTVEKIYHAAQEGDIYAHSLFQKLGKYLGIGIASLVNAIGIETVILGGGVSGAFDFFVDPLKEELARRTYKETARRVKILRAALGDEAGLLGGARSILTATR
ncbi:MAG: ROK family protein [Deltaproteobacteria bacterium]|nr:ROK family protein [Deltaproteobacteria bacterium]